MPQPDNKRVLDNPIYLDCPHWENEFLREWKREQGLWVPLNAPGQPEYTLRLCPTCADVVRKQVVYALIQPGLKDVLRELVRDHD